MMMMMNKSHSQPKYEACNYDHDYGFDLQQDFSLFLEEAKQQGHEAKLKSSSASSVLYPEGSVEKEKKGKKSWKSSLTSWWKKTDKKRKVKEEEEENKNNNSKSKVSGKRHVSGPIHNYSYNGHRLITLSGPLTNMFKGTKREENEIPYMSLHPQNTTTNAVHNYGPLYVVT